MSANIFSARFARARFGTSHFCASPAVLSMPHSTLCMPALHLLSLRSPLRDEAFIYSRRSGPASSSPPCTSIKGGPKSAAASPSSVARGLDHNLDGSGGARRVGEELVDLAHRLQLHCALPGLGELGGLPAMHNARRVRVHLMSESHLIRLALHSGTPIGTLTAAGETPLSSCCCTRLITHLP